MLINMKLGVRLYGGFFLIVLLLGTISAYQIYSSYHLTELQKKTAIETAESHIIKDISNRVSLVYPVISDAIINKNFKETKKEFSKIRETAEQDISTTQNLSNTVEEKSFDE